MSGHSKWATTKHKKALVDAKRSASFTKLANIVTIAARGGGDPTMNFQLRMAIDKAKAASMPKENIDRAIRRGTGEGGGVVIEEIIYEGYGPCGVAIIIQCLTDNRLRTVSNIRAAFNKFGGSLAEAGSVVYLFEKKGQIIISQTANTSLSSSDGGARSHSSLSERAHPSESKTGDPLIVDSRRNLPRDSVRGGNDGDQLEELIIESGADNFDIEDDTIIVYTQVADLPSVSKFLEDAGIKLESSDLIYIPKATIPIADDKQASLEKLIDVLESDDDVSNVYSNIN